MKIDGYSAVEVSFGLPPQPETFDLKAELRGMLAAGELFDQITADRNELARLRERVAGLLERNTSLVHAKRDLEAQVREFDRDLTLLQQAQVKAERANRESCREEIRCLEARVKELEAETNGCGVNVRDIPIREVPIHSRRDAN